MMATEVTESRWPMWVNIGRLQLCLDASWPTSGYREINLGLHWDRDGSGLNVIVQPWWGWMHFQAAWLPKEED